MSDDDRRVGRRAVLRGVGAGVGVAALTAAASAQRLGPATPEMAGSTDPHTAATFGALVDAVLPETPELADRIGPAHGPGGLQVDLDEFLVTYVNTLFQHGMPGLGHLEDIRLAEAIATVLDGAATELVGRGLNDHQPGAYAPDGEDWSAGGPFSRLHRTDRIRAIGLFDEDEKDFESSSLPGPVFEGDAGLVAQLVVAFTEVVYYSEWEGYPDGAGLTAPPSDRSHENDPAAVQSWRQTGFPGNVEGNKALRGFLGHPSSSLGEGRTWTQIREGEPPYPHVQRDPGSFVENDYETSDYEEPISTSEPAQSGEVGSGVDVEHGQAHADAGVDASTGDRPLDGIRTLVERW